jgi:hypothetical protein
MESIWFDGVHGDEIPHHHLCPAEGEFPILCVITGTRMTAHGDPISGIVIDQQGRNLVDLLLAGAIEEFPAGLKGDRFHAQGANLP